MWESLTFDFYTNEPTQRGKNIDISAVDTQYPRVKIFLTSLSIGGNKDTVKPVLFVNMI
jgi:hypothetical protein